MSNINISNRYATALLELAEEKKSLEEIAVDVELVKNTLFGSKQIQLMLLNPIIKSEKKLQILTEIFKGRVSDEILDFMLFILKKNREDLLTMIIKRFLELRDERLGIVDAKVLSIVEFTVEQKKKLQQKLEEVTKKKIRITFSQDKNLIGGFIIKLKDTVYDASIKHQLELLKENFLKGNIQQN